MEYLADESIGLPRDQRNFRQTQLNSCRNRTDDGCPVAKVYPGTGTRDEVRDEGKVRIKVMISMSLNSDKARIGLGSMGPK